MAHREVVEQAVSAGLRRGGRHFRLRQNPFQTRDGQPAHILDAVMARHYHVHTRQTAHRSDINNIVLRLGITLIPIAALFTAWIILRKKYKIDEKEYEHICAEIKNR